MQRAKDMKLGQRLDKWRNSCFEADREDDQLRSSTTKSAAGDPFGRFVMRTRGFSTMPKNKFRSRSLSLGAVIVICQGITAALKDSSRTTRALGSGILSFGAGIATVALAFLVLGRYVRIGIARYRQVAMLSAFLLAFIIATGAAVRLTGSGLGCPDWPTCKAGKIVPASGTHAFIEFGNRMVTGLCVLAAAVGVMTAMVRRPYRKDLVHYGLLVSALLFGNAIVGGLTVQYHLNPYFVVSHFFLAIASLTTGLLIFHRSVETGGSGSLLGLDRSPAVDPPTVRLTHLLTVAGAITVLLGTLVTGSGPHGGSDPDDPALLVRFGFRLDMIAKVHSVAVWITLAIIVTLGWRLRSATEGAAIALRKRVTLLAAVAVGQGAIGYAQWFNQLPAALVGLHVLGATCFWITILWVRAAATQPIARAPQTSVTRSYASLPLSQP
jgi:heme a synthase